MKKIPGYENYSATENGRIYSHLSKKYLKPIPYISGGYYNVSLYKDREQKIFRIHRLIILTFIGPRQNDMQIAHIDGNKYNNSIQNLKYVSAQENNDHKEIHGTVARGEGHGMALLKKEVVLKIRSSFVRKNKTRSNAKELSEKFGVSLVSVRNAVNRRTWKHI